MNALHVRSQGGDWEMNALHVPWTPVESIPVVAKMRSQAPCPAASGFPTPRGVEPCPCAMCDKGKCMAHTVARYAVRVGGVDVDGRAGLHVLPHGPCVFAAWLRCFASQNFGTTEPEKTIFFCICHIFWDGKTRKGLCRCDAKEFTDNVARAGYALRGGAVGVG